MGVKYNTKHYLKLEKTMNTMLEEKIPLEKIFELRGLYLYVIFEFKYSNEIYELHCELNFWNFLKNNENFAKEIIFDEIWNLEEKLKNYLRNYSFLIDINEKRIVFYIKKCLKIDELKFNKDSDKIKIFKWEKMEEDLMVGELQHKFIEKMILEKNFSTGNFSIKNYQLKDKYFGISANIPIV